MADTEDMILPKGIVSNNISIYDQIASYDVLPLEKILGACHVYSTTSRELVDPTARRLENFWTRVLGGDRRYLPGAVIARLFRSISEENSFVKLRGPSNRYEPPSPESQDDPFHGVPAKPKVSVGGPIESRSKGKTKATPASSTKQAKPILKKPRGPSHSGPRPTARFVSPPGSDGEEEKFASSGSTTLNRSVDSRGSGSSTAKEEKKKVTTTTSKKKPGTFVASTASKRRPAMPRRQSSQSSPAGGSEVGSKEGSSSSGSRNAGLQSSASTIPERTSEGMTSETKEVRERLSAKAAGKRPATRPPPPDKPPVSRPSLPQASNTPDRPTAVQETSFDVKQPKLATDSKGKAPMYDVSQMMAAPGGTTHRRSDAQERPRPDVAPLMNRSMSDIGSQRRSSRDLNHPRATPQRLISSTTATVSNTIAQGTIIEYDENYAATEAVMNAMRGQEEDSETSSRRSGSSVLDSRFTPTQPSPTPSVPLGRSKSQLTLLLERQGEKKSRR
ncbi:hypothetical protein F4779DRAFT_615596 [Xylariaceae sp. FL0662B]|nr:hypothetical protein F4779DRAFT_615596 [Xylariaceae sp. FL0662B]